MASRPTEVVRVLLTEDNPGDARLIKEIFAEPAARPFEVRCASRLCEGLRMIDEADIVLLDLSLPDSYGYERFSRARERAPDKAVVLLTGSNDETLAAETLRAGAQDYMIKGQVDSHRLSRAIRHALERKQAEAERERLIGELQAALAEVKRLQGLLPICSYCKSVPPLSSSS